jgi:phosphatidylserine decarboxylase
MTMETKINARTAGSWMPATPQAAAAFLNGLRNKATDKKRMLAPEEKKYEPIVERLEILINTDPVIRMYLKQMIDQVPGYYREKESPGFYLESIEELLDLLNLILQYAPEYNDTDLVGFPVNTILDWTMGMPAGFALFRLDQLNAWFREYLAVWCDFLNSEQSLYVLNDSEKGWKCDAAQKKLDMSQYQYNTDDPYWGFKSWNDFFTRRLAAGVYPLKDKDRESNIIVSACASQVYAIKNNVNTFDWFWVKSQPYSFPAKTIMDKE